MRAQYSTQLKYRKRDAKGDYCFGHGDDDFLYGLDAMKQVIQTRLAAIYGEWWEGDPTAIPYYPDVLGVPATGANKDAIDLMIIQRIMDTVGVNGVGNVTSSYDGRHYSFSCTVNTVYGETYAEVNL